MKNVFVSLLVISSFVSCMPATQIEKTWREPGATVSPGPENKAMIIAMVKDETSRRVIEDELSKRFSNAAVVSYKILPLEILKGASEEALSKSLKDGGFTHVLLMRLADVEKETSYVPGNANVGFYGGYGRYYGYGAGFYSNPGYYTTDKNYFIETTIYSVNPDKLLWTGTTKTVNPSKIDKVVNEIADVVTARMRSEGFLK